MKIKLNLQIICSKVNSVVWAPIHFKIQIWKGKLET